MHPNPYIMLLGGFVVGLYTWDLVTRFTRRPPIPLAASVSTILFMLGLVVLQFFPEMDLDVKDSLLIGGGLATCMVWCVAATRLARKEARVPQSRQEEPAVQSALHDQVAPARGSANRIQ